MCGRLPPLHMHSGGFLHVRASLSGTRCGCWGHQGGVGYMAEQVELNQILRGKDGKRMFPIEPVLESDVSRLS